MMHLIAAMVLAGLAAGNGTLGDERPAPPFALGVEYLVPGLAETYAKTGVTWGKAMGAGFAWGDVEPKPPVDGRHTYDWRYPDRLILEYQRAGFRQFHVYVKCRNPWATSKPLPLLGTPSFPPKPEYMTDYAACLRALVERYDKDGQDDAPGLLYPVRYWEIESEWGTFWPGTTAEYLDLLKVAHAAVKSADPDAQVVLVGFLLPGVFEANPDPAAALQAFRQRHPPHRVRTVDRGIDDTKALLAHPELFDVVEFHSLSDWTEISGMSRFLRGLMRQHGYEKPIWVGDVNFTASPMLFWGMPVPPYSDQQKPGLEAALRALANAKHSQHAEVEAWFRREQATGLVKKVVLAMGEGLAGINIGNLEDWGIFALAPTIAGTSAFHGLIQTKGIPPTPGEPRPAYHALTLVARKLADFSAVKQVPVGAGVYCYRFTVRNKPVHVLWYDDGRRYLPGDTEPIATVELRLPPRPHQLTATPTERRVTTPPARTVAPSAGVLKLEAGSIPLFLEEAAP
jgi:hypothetical protein